MSRSTGVPPVGGTVISLARIAGVPPAHLPVVGWVEPVGRAYLPDADRPAIVGQVCPTYDYDLRALGPAATGGTPSPPSRRSAACG